MIVKLPRGLEIDIDNIPEDFEKQIQDCFAYYTEGTDEAYTFQDKLCFIDVCIYCLHGNVCSDDAVMELVKDSIESDLRNGEFPQESDYYSLEYMEYCYNQGRESQKLYSKQFGGRYRDHHLEEKVEKLILRIITAVAMWGRDDSIIVKGRCPSCLKYFGMSKKDQYSFCPHCGWKLNSH